MLIVLNIIVGFLCVYTGLTVYHNAEETKDLKKKVNKHLLLAFQVILGVGLLLGMWILSYNG